MNLPRRAEFGFISDAQNGPDTQGVAGRAFQPDPQAGFCQAIVQQPGPGRVLGHRDINPTIPIIIAESGPALLAIDKNPGLLPRNGGESPRAIAAQPQAASRILARY